MIYVELTGGLGNQLFQYALGRVIEEYRKDNVTYVSKSYKTDELRDLTLNKFNIKDNWTQDNSFDYFESHKVLKFLYRAFNRIEYTFNKRPVNNELNSFYVFKTKMFYMLGLYTHMDHAYTKLYMHEFPKNIYAQGLWHYPEYFNGIKDKLLTELTLKDKSVLPENFLKQIRNSESVCVHIRRGDYVNIPNYIVCDINYYIDAMNQMRDLHKGCKFFVFSDDIEWVKENMPSQSDIVFVEEKNADYVDFGLMCECRHFIISNSTFSWWAAYLGKAENKTVMTPDKWYNNGENKPQLNLNGWIVLKTNLA